MWLKHRNSQKDGQLAHPGPWEEASNLFQYFKIVDNYYYQLVEHSRPVSALVENDGTSLVEAPPGGEKKKRWWHLRPRFSRHRCKKEKVSWWNSCK